MSKHIYIYSPSGAVREKDAFRRGVARLQALGHRVEVDRDALRSHMRFAGDDDTRVAAIHRAAASGADWALMSRGGYGLTRLLHRLDYKLLAKAVGDGMQFLGHSDFTALQCAMLARTGTGSWAGPALAADFGREPAPDEITLACFDDVVGGRSHGTGWRLPGRRTSDARNASADAPLARPIRSSTLWGGNLSILCALVGTPWLPNVERGVLYIEDVSEHPYRVERMLTQLLHAGVLQRQRAVLVGQFSGYTLLPHDRGYSMKTVLAWLRQQTKVPLLEGLPFGHVPTKVMLPMGTKVDLVVEDREVLLLW